MSSDLPSGDPSARPEVVADLGATLVEALERHLPGARKHAESTAAYALAAAAELGLVRERAELVREAAKLHDVGMVYIPAAVLRKPHAELSEEERELLDGHIEFGSRLALGAGIPEDVCEWILSTRERWDGRGPAGLAADAIPIESRIVRVACAADLMLASAPVEDMVAGLRVAAGGELDPRVVAAVAKVLNRIVPAA
jgi:HD-GYP domain-containing protein (c-di-GMP phosphodiesterase class II)